jgi:hypothetical protein
MVMGMKIGMTPARARWIQFNATLGGVEPLGEEINKVLTTYNKKGALGRLWSNLSVDLSDEAYIELTSLQKHFGGLGQLEYVRDRVLVKQPGTERWQWVDNVWLQRGKK